MRFSTTPGRRRPHRRIVAEAARAPPRPHPALRAAAGRDSAVHPVRRGLRGAAGRSALRAWSSLGHLRRAAVVLDFHDRLLAQREDVLDLIQLETGKTRANAFDEVAEVANVARYYARRRSLLAPPGAGRVAGRWARHQPRLPRGVVGIITPWNYPFALSLGDAVAALLAGNAVVLRPDPRTCLSVLWGC
ncbi:MAG: aldehyde dehydrogenase family protein, partial [Micropruina sp.]|nr:aldehyde dehydrogenase family protein [Micropruina sp.]